MLRFSIRPSRSAAVLLAVVAAGLLATVPAQAAKRPPRVTPGSTYLAIGDSVSFGYQEPQVVPAPDYTKASTFQGFPEHLASRLRLKLFNAACPGETSASLLDAKAPSNSCENVPAGGGVAYRTRFPLHVRYAGSQIDYAVRFLRKHPRTRLVSLMIGANDYFLCQRTTADACAAPGEQAATLSAIRANTRKALSAIRRKAHYRGQLAIVHYYSLNYAVPAVNALSASLNTALDRAAKGFDVIRADGFGVLQAASARFGGQPCAAGLLTQLGQPGSCGVHPSYAGQVLLSHALERAIRL